MSYGLTSCLSVSYELVQNDETQQMEARTMDTEEMRDRGCRHYEFYVWDNVGIALHVKERKVITSSLSSCPQLSVRLFSTLHIFIYFQDNFVGLIRVDLVRLQGLISEFNISSFSQKHHGHVIKEIQNIPKK